jgi:hypothetical protein
MQKGRMEADAQEVTFDEPLRGRTFSITDKDPFTFRKSFFRKSAPKKLTRGVSFDINMEK